MNQTRYNDYPPVTVTTGAERISIDGSKPEQSMVHNTPYNIQSQRKSHLEYVTASCNSKYYATSKSTVFARGSVINTPEQSHRRSTAEYYQTNSILSPMTSNKHMESVLS